jgi:hypothetical protein
VSSAVKKKRQTYNRGSFVLGGKFRVPYQKPVAKLPKKQPTVKQP